MEFISYLCDYALIFNELIGGSLSDCNNSMGGLEGWWEIVSKLYSGKSGLSDTHTQATKPWWYINSVRVLFSILWRSGEKWGKVVGSGIE